MKKRGLIFFGLGVFILSFILTSIFYLSPWGKYPFFFAYDKIYDTNYTKFQNVADIVDDTFIGQVPKGRVFESAIHGYVQSLNDKYTTYLYTSKYQSVQSDLSGSYSGIGIEIQAIDQGLLIKSVKEGLSAYKAGLKAGDIVIKYNGQDIDKNLIAKINEDIKSKKEGEKITFGILRDGKNLDIELIVESIKIENVKGFMVQDNIGYIRLNTFNEDAGKDFKETCETLKSDGAKGIIIDLRNNPGGVLQSATSIIDYIVPKGIITTVKYKDGSKEEYFSDKNELDLKICVLINEKSASASEITSACIKDYKKGVLIGKNTYGKGVVQAVYDFGDSTGLMLSIAKYYTPNGICIDEIGVAPDFEVDNKEGFIFDGEKLDKENDLQFLKAMEVMSEMIK